MLRAYIRSVRIAVAASCVIPLIVMAYNIARTYSRIPDSSNWDALALKVVTVVLLVIVGGAAVFFLPRRFAGDIDRLSQEQSRLADSLPPTWLDWAIFGAAGLSLLLELAVIRWQGAVFEVFAFYKNFSLLACFLGLGLGYALSKRLPIPLFFTIPLLAWQMLLFVVSRHGPEGWTSGVFMLAPVLEVHHMGLYGFQADLKSVAYYGAVLYLLAAVFVLTALAFVPVGQLCGSLMNQRQRLRAYGLNLLGSLLGVSAMLGLSMLWTPPLVWFSLCFAALLVFQPLNSRLLLSSVLAGLLGLVALGWPVTFLWEQNPLAVSTDRTRPRVPWPDDPQGGRNLLSADSRFLLG